MVFRLGCIYNNCRGLHPFYIENKNFLLTKPSPTLPLPLHPRTQGALADTDRGAPFVPAQPPLYRHNPYCSLFQGLCFNFVFFSRSNHAIAILIMLQFSFLSFSVMGLHALISFLLMAVSDQQKVRALRVLRPISGHNLFSLKR